MFEFLDLINCSYSYKSWDGNMKVEGRRISRVEGSWFTDLELVVGEGRLEVVI